MLYQLVVSTPVKNISQFGMTSPSRGSRGENKKYLKAPPSLGFPWISNQEVAMKVPPIGGF